MQTVTEPTCGILVGEAEIIGERCLDGGMCHHKCETTCFRKDGCVPLRLSGLNDDWTKPVNELQEARDRIKALEDKIEVVRHVSNEWADMACNGIQWIKNIKEGISTPEAALENLGTNLEHCRKTYEESK